MSPPKPRKPRIGNRRQFRGARHPALGGPGGVPHGSDQEWEQVLQSPQVQAALRDPAIASALYQNFRGTGGTLGGPDATPSLSPGAGAALPPVAMQTGGMANALDINEIMQMLADPNTSEARKMSLRASLARLAEQRPQLPVASDDDEALRLRPLRFQGGGLQDSIHQLESDLQQVNAKPNKNAADYEKIRTINSTLATLRMQTMQPVSMGSAGNLSAGTMSGLQQIAQSGVPANFGNTAAAMGMAGLIGLTSSQTPGPAALVGALTAGALNYLIRRAGQKKKPGAVGSTSGSGDSGYTGGTSGEGEGPAHASPTPTPVQTSSTQTDASQIVGSAATPTTPTTANTGAGNDSRDKGTVVPVYEPWKDPKSPYYKKPAENVLVSQAPANTTIPTGQTPVSDIATSPGGGGDASQPYDVPLPPGGRFLPQGAQPVTPINVATSAGSPAPYGPGQGLWMGSARSQSGNVYSRNGRDWYDSNTNQPYSGVVLSPTRVNPGSSLASAGPGQPTANLPGGGALDIRNLANQNPTFNPMLAPGYINPASFGQGAADVGPGTGVTDLSNEQGAAADLPPLDNMFYDSEEGFARGGRFADSGLGTVRRSPREALLGPPHGLPHGMPIPILHTTIVIAAKPKPEKKKPEAKKKAEGGVVRPKRPDLIPPRRGPQDGMEVRPRPHGRVQVPRGSGAAIRGKRFGGIY